MARQVVGVAAAVVVVIAWSGTMALGAVGRLAEGEIVAWGSNVYGQTTVPAGNNYVAIAGGDAYSVALRSDGSLAAWGSNSQGQTTVPAGNNFVAVAGGYSHSVALRSDGSLAAWGSNVYGQTTVPAGNNFVAVAGGGFHSVALRSDGSLAAWGYNGNGETIVPAGNDYVAVAAGGQFSLALRSDGSLAAWGFYLNGQTTVPDGNDFVAVAGGNIHGLAVRSDGSLAAWGDNFFGQTTVPAGNNFVAVAGGGFYSLALRSDGSLAAWGDNGYGQTTVPAGNNYVAVEAGGFHSLALVGRTSYDGDLLIFGSGVNANLNRTITVAGDATIRSASLGFFNNPTATISGKLIIDGASTSGNGAIIANGIELKSDFDLYNNFQLASTGPLTGAGNLALQDFSRLDVGLGSPGLYSGSVTIAPGAALVFNGQGLQTAGALDVLNGGELRMGAGQTVRLASIISSTNAGAIQLIGNSFLGPSEIEFVSTLDNAASTGLIAGQNAVMRFTGGLTNSGSMALSSGVNNAFGDITNNAGATISVTGGAAATFYDDIVQNGTFRVAKVGSTTSTAVVLGSFTGSGGSTGGGDIFFEGDLRPGNSPASVTFANNIALGGGASLAIELGGLAAGSQYDRVSVTGSLGLGGSLDVELINGFTPAAGNTFDILDFNSATLSGTFDTVSLPALGGGLAWNTSQLYTTGVLSVDSAGVPGDYNSNGTVDAADYVVWRNGGSPDSTQAGYNLWKANFGSTAGSGSAVNGFGAAVPEPSSFLLLTGAVGWCLFVRCSRVGGEPLPNPPRVQGGAGTIQLYGSVACCGRLHAGGMGAISRRLSAAIPPDAMAKFRMPLEGS